MITQSPPQFPRQLPEVRGIADIIISWTRQIDRYVHFYFAGALGQYKHTICQE